MNVEDRLIDTLADDDTWSQREWTDPVGRVTTAYRRRRRHRMAAGLTVTAAVTVVAAAGAMRWQAGNDTVILPAGPPRQPVVTDTPSATLQEQAAAAERAQERAAQAAAERAAGQGNAIHCPRSPQTISPDMRDEAFQAVVAYNRDLAPGFNASTLRRDRVAIASDDVSRGAEVTTNCGALAATRTFVVYTTRTDRQPRAGQSQSVYFVSRTSDRFQVWEQTH